MQAWTPAFYLPRPMTHVWGLARVPCPITPSDARSAKQGQLCQELGSAAPGPSGRKAGAWASPDSHQASWVVPVLRPSREGYLKPS